MTSLGPGKVVQDFKPRRLRQGERLSLASYFVSVHLPHLLIGLLKIRQPMDRQEGEGRTSLQSGGLWEKAEVRIRQ